MRTILIILAILNSSYLFAGTNGMPAKNSDLKTNVNQTSSQIRKITVDSVPDLKLDVKTGINWYLVLLPLVTIAIVIGSTFVTLHSMRINADNTKSTFLETIAVQREISEREIKTRVLADNRQKWINELRNDLAEFIASLHHLSAYLDIVQKDPVKPALAEYLSRSELKQAKIKLLINPNETDHKKLVELIDEIMEEAYKEERKIFGPLKELLTISQKILKREWERVKDLE